MADSVDDPQTQATYTVEEFRILVDLTAARLFDLGRDLASFAGTDGALLRAAGFVSGSSGAVR